MSLIITRGLGTSTIIGGDGAFSPILDFDVIFELSTPAGLLIENLDLLSTPSGFTVEDTSVIVSTPLGLLVIGDEPIQIPSGFTVTNEDFVSVPTGFAVEEI